MERRSNDDGFLLSVVVVMGSGDVVVVVVVVAPMVVTPLSLLFSSFNSLPPSLPLPNPWLLLLLNLPFDDFGLDGGVSRCNSTSPSGRSSSSSYSSKSSLKLSIVSSSKSLLAFWRCKFPSLSFAFLDVVAFFC